jgi:uncharacterized membrane protein YidH (DUF202 family)
MEQMTPVEDLNILENEVHPEMEKQVAEAAKWAKYFAIGTLVSTGMSFIVKFIAINKLGSSNSGFGNVAQIRSMAIDGSIFGDIIVLGIVIVSAMGLLNFSKKTQKAIELKDGHLLAQSFGNLKSAFLVWGICSIVLLVFFALGSLGDLRNL